jgi:hypothetical protein
VITTGPDTVAVLVLAWVLVLVPAGAVVVPCWCGRWHRRYAVLVLARVLTPAVLAVLSVTVIAVLVATLVVNLIVVHPCRRPCRPRHGAFYKKPERDTSTGRNGRLLSKIAGKRSYAGKCKSLRMALLPPKLYLQRINKSLKELLQ